MREARRDYDDDQVIEDIEGSCLVRMDLAEEKGGLNVRRICCGVLVCVSGKKGEGLGSSGMRRVRLW